MSRSSDFRVVATPSRRRVGGVRGLVAGTLAIAFLASPVSAKTVKATFKIGGKDCEVTSVLDGGATGVGASEISRAEARKCGLIDDKGEFVKEHFQTDGTGAIITKKFEQADGTTIEYALSKPIEIKITDDNGTVCPATVPVTVIVDKTKKGSNLIGRDWGSIAKVTETWADNKATWPNDPKEAKGKVKNVDAKKTKQDSDGEMKYWDGLRLGLSPDPDVEAEAFLMLGLPHAAILSQELAAVLGLSTTGSMDLTDTDELEELLKYGFYADSSPSFGIFDLAVVPFFHLLTDDGTPVIATDVTVLINRVSDLNVLGRNFFLDELDSIGGLQIVSSGYLHETQTFWFEPVPEPGALVLLATGIVLGVWNRRREARQVVAANST